MLLLHHKTFRYTSSNYRHINVFFVNMYIHYGCKDTQLVFNIHTGIHIYKLTTTLLITTSPTIKY